MPLNNNPIKYFYCSWCKKPQQSKCYICYKKKFYHLCGFCGRKIRERSEVRKLFTSRREKKPKVQRKQKYCSKCRQEIHHNNKSGLCRACWVRDYARRKREQELKGGDGL